MKKIRKSIVVVVALSVMFIFAACTKDNVNSQPKTPAITTAESGEGSETSETTGVEASAEAEHDDENDFLALKSLTAKAIGIKNLYFEYELRVDGVSKEYYSKWTDGTMMRIDPHDQKHRIYVDLEKTMVQVYNLETNTVYPAVFEEAQFKSMFSPVAFEEVLEPDMFDHVHFTGSAIIDGKPCDVFEVNAVDFTVVYYLWKENGLTVKMTAQVSGLPSYEYYFRSLEIINDDKGILLPPANVEKKDETVEIPSTRVGKQ
jgi:hypothetical protein